MNTEYISAIQNIMVERVDDLNLTMFYMNLAKELVWNTPTPDSSRSPRCRDCNQTWSEHQRNWGSCHEFMVLAIWEFERNIRFAHLHLDLLLTTRISVWCDS